MFEIRSFMKKLCCLIAIIIVILSCEKDDICPEGTPGTPHLIITFEDISSGLRKNVTNLRIVGIDGTTETQYGTISTTDSIAIPLRVFGPTDPTTGITNTSYKLISNFDDNGTEDTSDDTGNSDDIVITYENEEVFISRACGYKNIFNNTAIGFTNDGDNWILNTNVVTNQIENENNAHINIRH